MKELRRTKDKYFVDDKEISKEEYDELMKNFIESLPVVEAKEVEQPKATYEEQVEKLIREKYSLNEELALLRQRETKPQEFMIYFNYVEECKNKAKEGKLYGLLY